MLGRWTVRPWLCGIFLFLSAMYPTQLAICFSGDYSHDCQNHAELPVWMGCMNFLGAMGLWLSYVSRIVSHMCWTFSNSYQLIMTHCAKVDGKKVGEAVDW